MAKSKSAGRGKGKGRSKGGPPWIRTGGAPPKRKRPGGPPRADADGAAAPKRTHRPADSTGAAPAVEPGATGMVEDELRPPRPVARGQRPGSRARNAPPSRGIRRGEPVGPELPEPHRRRRNVRLTLEYHGGRFHGWQVQPKVRTVAGVLAAAIHAVVGEDVMLLGSGRTDEGVHAEGQVANFLTRSRMPCEGLQARIEAELPPDVRILRVEDVGPDFHSRHSATARVYRYDVLRRPSVFKKGLAWVVTGPLDLEAMRTGLGWFVGRHDFTAFCDLKLLAGASTLVEVTQADCKETGHALSFRIAGSHFLPRMVRRLVGCIVKVGMGDIPLATLRDWMERPVAGAAAPHTAPAMGLYLEQVEYTPGGRRPLNPTARRALQALGSRTRP